MNWEARFSIGALGNWINRCRGLEIVELMMLCYYGEDKLQNSR